MALIPETENYETMRGFLNLYQRHLDISDPKVAVSEVWAMDLDKYDLIPEDRNRHGGRVAIFIRNTVNYKIRSDIMSENLETITVEITKPKAKPFLLSTWYRPPNMPVNVFIDYQLIVQEMDHENKEIICIGDFNCDWFGSRK